MKIESQVCSLELSEKLRKLGVKQESIFIWVSQKEYITPGSEMSLSNQVVLRTHAIEFFYRANPIIAAYTVTELGEILSKVSKTNYTLESIWKCDGHYKICIYDGPIHGQDGYALNEWVFELEADCRAKALIWCIENGIVQP